MSCKRSEDYKTIKQCTETDCVSTAQYTEFDFDKAKDQTIARTDDEPSNDEPSNDEPSNDDDEYQTVEKQRVRDMKVIFRFSDRPEWLAIDIEFDPNSSEKRNLIDAGTLIDCIPKEQMPKDIQGYDENLLLIYDDMPFQTHDECRRFAESLRHIMECYSKLFNIGVKFF